MGVDVLVAAGEVVALLLEGFEVVGGDVAGDVGAVEDRGVEVSEAGAGLGDGLLEVAEVLEDDAVGADVLRELVDGFAAGDELGAGGACRCSRRWDR